MTSYYMTNCSYNTFPLSVVVQMNQYKICLVSITIAILSLSMILDRIYFGMLLLASLCSWSITTGLIPKLSQYMLKADVFGYDINKKGSQQGEKKIPQCMGYACAIGFTIISYFYYPYGQPNDQKVQSIMNTHNACMITIISTVLFGFTDDMLDFAWRYKLIYPFFFMIPVIKIFNGSTQIPIPFPFSYIAGNSIDLGYLFYLYIILLGIYFTNTINIYAGINGLQVGQSIIAACSLVVLFSVRAVMTGDSTKYEYSSFLLITFLSCSLAIMKYNAYPSQVFIGDTYCYFAGIILVLSSIFSQTSIVIHFLLIPQLINFLYSTPQLFGFYPCPRHRLTKYLKQKDELKAIETNMNLLNLSLRILGPTNEGTLCKKLLVFQIITSMLAILGSMLFL